MTSKDLMEIDQHGFIDLVSVLRCQSVLNSKVNSQLPFPRDFKAIAQKKNHKNHLSQDLCDLHFSLWPRDGALIAQRALFIDAYLSLCINGRECGSLHMSPLPPARCAWHQ